MTSAKGMSLKLAAPVAALAVMTAVAGALPAVTTVAQEQSRQFPETGRTVKGKFLQYWDSHGGLTQQGYPISDEMQERSDTDGKTYTVQYFERAVFEYHPGNQPPYDVLLSLLGTSLYRQKHPNGAPGQEPSAEPNARMFSETGKKVGGVFLAYWNTHGGLAQQGYPISDELEENSDLDGKTYRVQYFERAVFEYHPKNQAPYNVLLSQLGTFQYRARYAVASVGHVEATGSMRVARSCHTATLLPGGKVLIAGGMVREGNYTPTAELFDPAAGAFSNTGSLSVGRACHSAVLQQDGKVLIVGGTFTGRPVPAELFDPSAGTFATTGTPTVNRDAFTATLLANGKVLIAGGYDRGMLASTELYDPSTGVFSPAANLTEPRATHTAVLMRDGKVLVTGGGASQGGGIVLGTAEIFDPQTGRWTPTGRMQATRYKHAAALLSTGQVLIVGGSDNRDWRGRYASTEVFDPGTGRFSRGGAMDEARFKISAAVVPLVSGNVLVAGGGTHVEVYDPTTATFATAHGTLDAPRFYQTATELPGGGVLITGGYDTNIASTTSAWLYR
jgi:hypothetical protein